MIRKEKFDESARHARAGAVRLRGRRPLSKWILPICLATLSGSALAAAATPATSAANSPSIWIQGEQLRFGELLAKQPVDVLIIPFQVQGHGLDPTERTLLATTMADHLSATTALKVADPVLVGRALGEGSRKYETPDILALGDRAGAKFILIGLAGHDGQSQLRVQLKVMSKDGAQRTWREAGQRDWPSLSLSDEEPPYRAIAKVLGDIGPMLGAQSKTGAAPKVSVAKVDALPALTDVIAGKGAHAQNLHVAQLLASFYPRYPEAGNERAWVQTLRLAHAASIDGKQLAIARALLHLGRRPAALAALREPRTSAEHALRDVLNGNLPAATRHAQQIKDPVLRLTAQIELRDLRKEYGAANPTMEVAALSQLVPEDSDWYQLAYPRVHGEGGLWGVESTMDAYVRFSALIDTSERTEAVVARLITTQKDDSALELEIGRTALARYDALVRDQNVPAPAVAPLMRWLVLDLYQAQVLTDLLGDIYLTMDTRVALESASSMLASYDSVLRGHPDFIAAKARLAWREYARWRGEQRAQWLAHALRNSHDAYRHSNRLSRALEFTERQAASTPQIAAALDPVRTQYFWDWPVTTTWVPAAVREDRKAMQRYAHAFVKYATTEYSTLSWLAERPALAGQQNALWQATQNRFDGAPGLVQDRTEELLSRFELRGAEDILRRYVNERPLGLGPYYQYAEFLIAQGRHRDAWQMFNAYPGFEKESGENHVGLSNAAGYVAWMWWRIGQFDYAMPFFQRSAAYDTGSAYSLGSAALLTLDSGDPNTAAKRYMELARRYSDLDALDRYFKLMFPLGRPEEAWRIYEEVHRDGNGGRVLGSIANGARVIGWTDPQILDWLASTKNATLADGTFHYAPRAALAAATIDRDPRDLTAVLRVFNVPSPYEIDREAGKIVKRADPAVKELQERPICGPSRYADGPAAGLNGRDRIDSHLSYFAKGYQALNRDRFAEAFQVFDEAARLFEFYEQRCERVGYLLPYLALAAANVKSTAALEQYLQNVSYSDRSFNYNLALGTMAAVKLDHAEADRRFDAALNRGVFDLYDALPASFIYADILERLYELTKEDRYRERLVRWAKIRQRVAPSDAWAYAKEYRYTSNAADRERALGMALYLDRQSATLRGVSASEAAAASAALEPRNPFLAWRKPPRAQKGQQKNGVRL